MSNNLAQKKIGRQLWAAFQFGSKVSGVMRFCPLPKNSRPASTCEKFEKLCVLKKGIWPGDVASKEGKSFQKWGLRWRARKEGSPGDSYRYSDTIECMLEFKKDEDATLKIDGTMVALSVLCGWEGVKVADGELAHEDFTEVWDDYAL